MIVAWIVQSLLLGFVSLVFSPAAFSPLFETRRFNSSQPPRFHLADMAVLAVQLQLLAATLTFLHPDPQEVIKLVTLLGGLLTIWWLGGVWLLTCAAITRTRTRVFFLSCIAPIGYLASMLTAGIPLWLVLAVLSAIYGCMTHDLQALWWLLLLAVAAGAYGGLFVWPRLYCQHLAMRSFQTPA